MAIETYALDQFYVTQQGAVVARLVRGRLQVLWPDLTSQNVLGIGYSAPYLRLWRERAKRCVAVTPAHMGPGGWPATAPSLCCMAGEDALPFPDLFFDRVLLVHGLETSDNARRLLREVWRILKDDGRVIVVAPNRRGMWAHSDSTPFGHGQPYSLGQMRRLLSAAMFTVERRDTALYMPPTRLRIVLRGAPAWERLGRRFLPRLGGVTLMEAVKDMYAVVPAGAEPARRTVFAEPA